MEFEDFLSVNEDDVVISAAPTLVEKSESLNVFGYYFCIENHSENKIQLIGKNWNISDDRGNSFSDDSVGFKGEIPELEPGEFFEFTSEAPLQSNNAVFYGSCKIASEKGIKDIKIPTFTFATQGSVTMN